MSSGSSQYGYILSLRSRVTSWKLHCVEGTWQQFTGCVEATGSAQGHWRTPRVRMYRFLSLSGFNYSREEPFSLLSRVRDRGRWCLLPAFWEPSVQGPEAWPCVDFLVVFNWVLPPQLLLYFVYSHLEFLWFNFSNNKFFHKVSTLLCQRWGGDLRLHLPYRLPPSPLFPARRLTLAFHSIQYLAF